MDWECIVISMAPEDVDAFIDRMIALGIEQFALTDPREVSEFMQTSVYYDYVEENLVHKQKATLTVYVEKNNSGAEKMQQLFSLLQEANRRGVEFSVEIENIQEEDWMNSWKKFYKPIPVGEKLIIKPSWEALPEDNQRIPLEIDPSSSFAWQAWKKLFSQVRRYWIWDAVAAFWLWEHCCWEQNGRYA